MQTLTRAYPTDSLPQAYPGRFGLVVRQDHSTVFDSCPETGLIVLSSSMRILHINPRARELMALFGEAHGSRPHQSPESIPLGIVEFIDRVLTELHRCNCNLEWAEVDMSRICHMVTPALLLRGFGVPATEGLDPRIILTLKPCSSRTR